jgi:hypothetical protein
VNVGQRMQEPVTWQMQRLMILKVVAKELFLVCRFVAKINDLNLQKYDIIFYFSWFFSQLVGFPCHQIIPKFKTMIM